MTTTAAATTATSRPRMHIADAPRRELAAPSQVKITLTNEMRIRLHSRKLLQGVNIADTVQEALELFFAQNPDADKPKPRPSEA